MKSSKYWEDVALLREIAVQDGVTTSAEDILKLYDEALDDINREIKKIKANFMRRFGLDNKTATYFLEAAQEEENLQMLINALEAAPTEKAREDILTFIHLDGRSVRAYAARTERYKAVKKSIYARMAKLATDETKLMTDMLKNAYRESYYGLIDDAAKGFDVGINFALLDDDAIEEAIKTKWHGSRFSERIWKNTDRLAEEAQNLVAKALMSGESLTKTATKLADSFDVEKYHATTLVRTETAHAHAMADLKGYEDLGIKEYKYLATLDYLTCTRCQPLDGMVFKVSEAREGVNYPTLHPRCRCTTTVTGDFDKRSARNPITGKSELIDGNTTYTEWVKNMTPEQRQALELAKRKNERRTSDKLQHEKYKKLLGTKNVPKSFDKFQDLKYNNSELWNDLKKLYRHNKYGYTSGAINPNSVKAFEHAERYYKSVRKMKTDVKKIALNTGWKEEAVQKIKNHIFYDKHELIGGYGRFDPSYHMAVSWQNLIAGGSKIEEKDIVLLKHEYLELTLVKKGYSQDDAHIIASKKHDYSKLTEG